MDVLDRPPALSDSRIVAACWQKCEPNRLWQLAASPPGGPTSRISQAARLMPMTCPWSVTVTIPSARLSRIASRSCLVTPCGEDSPFAAVVARSPSLAEQRCANSRHYTVQWSESSSRDRCAGTSAWRGQYQFSRRAGLNLGKSALSPRKWVCPLTPIQNPRH